jgi:hypothetical protein
MTLCHGISARNQILSKSVQSYSNSFMRIEACAKQDCFEIVTKTHSPSWQTLGGMSYRSPLMHKGSWAPNCFHMRAETLRLADRSHTDSSSRVCSDEVRVNTVTSQPGGSLRGKKLNKFNRTCCNATTLRCVQARDFSALTDQTTIGSHQVISSSLCQGTLQFCH